MGFSVDEVSHAVVNGLQLGLAAWVVTWLAVTGGWLSCSPVCAFLVISLLGSFLAAYFDTLQVATADRAVFITGCDSGFGYELALRLQKLGLVVFAGCLLADKNGEGAKKLRDAQLPNLYVVQLDVTSDEEVKKALEYVRYNLPLKGLWGLVNNAGIFTFGYVEWSSVSMGKKVMDVNVHGMLRVTQAFLPLIRQSKGRVVNVGSVSGRQCSLNFTLYSISKYGIEALSDCLRFEMRRWGVKVALIEPGNFASATKLFLPDTIRATADSMWKNISESVQEDYTKKFFDSIVDKMIRQQGTPTPATLDMNPVLTAMTQALLQWFPHARYEPMDINYKLRTWVNTHLPEWIYEMFYT